MEFSQFIAQTKDSRRLQGQRYSYEAMMWMVFISIACGHESCRKMATFCRSYASVFTRYFSLKHGTPSYVTFHSFLSHINTFEMRQSFNQMMLKCLEFNEGDWISGDGQTLCSTVTDCHTDKQDYVSLVSLYCQKTGLSILLHEYMNKDKSESESKLVLKLLLENLANKGLMITLDALYCQKKTLDDIVSHGNDFTVQVKGNTPKLFDSVKSTVDVSPCIDAHVLEEKQNGIRTTWECYCYDYNNKVAGWESINLIIMICKTIIQKQKVTRQCRFYVSSATIGGKFSAEAFNLGIRGHWGIENKAHKNKDVLFKQDDNRVKATKHAVNRAIFNTIVLNFLITQYKQTITHSRILFSSDFQKICFKKRT